MATETAVTVLVKHTLDLPGERVAELIRKAILVGIEDAQLTHRDDDLDDDDDARDAATFDVVAVRHTE